MEQHSVKRVTDTSPAIGDQKSGKEKRRTSILKPPKVRTPLKVLEFTSQEVKDDATTRQSRRVSFAGLHVREFGLENGVVCDSVYFFEASKSDSSMHTNNSVDANGEVPAANNSHNSKNTSSGSTYCKKDTHVKINVCQNPAETENKINDTDICVSSLKNLALKQIPDGATEFSLIESVPPTHNSDLFYPKSKAVRTDCKENDYFEKENLMDQYSVVSGEMQRSHEQDDINKLKSFSKRGRKQCENDNQAEAHNCEQSLYSASVTDMELVDSYSVRHIECNEESLLGAKWKKNVDTAEKSFYYAAESDMELTKVVDTHCGVRLNTLENKSTSLNNIEAKDNLTSSGDGKITKTSGDFNSMKNITHQHNATKWYSTNDGMDITEGIGLIDCDSDNDIYNDGTIDVVNSRIIPFSKCSTHEEDIDRNDEKIVRCSIKDWNPSEFANKSFMNESMGQALALEHVLNKSDMDYTEVVGHFQINENTSFQLESSFDNIHSGECSGVTAAVKFTNENKLTDCPSDNTVGSDNLDFTQAGGDNYIEKCTETKLDDINDFNSSKTILMCVDVELTRNTCQNDQDDSSMQFTRVVEANIQENSMQDSLGPLEKRHGNHTELINTIENVSAIEKSTVKYDMHTTQTKTPLYDTKGVCELIIMESRTDTCITATSSDKVSACKDQQNDNVNSYISDTKQNHPSIVKLSGNEAAEKDVSKQSSVFELSDDSNYNGTVSTSVNHMEHCRDGSGSFNIACQTAAINTKTVNVLSTSPVLKTEIIQQGKQANDVSNSMCRVQSNSSIIGGNTDFCVTPISGAGKIPDSRESVNKIVTKHSEHRKNCSNRSEQHYLSVMAVEDSLVTDDKSECALACGMLNKKRRSSELEETGEDRSSPKKQCIATDHNISDEHSSQSHTEDNGLALEAKPLYGTDSTTALHVDSGVVNSVIPERPGLKCLNVSGDTHSVHTNNSNTLLGKTDVPNKSVSQPSSPNTTENFSNTGKPIVFNNESDCVLQMTNCETNSSSVALSTAQCKTKFCVSMLKIDKQTTDSALSENEELKSNTSYSDVTDSGGSCEQKKYTRDTEKESNTAAAPTNVSEIDVAHTVVREDKKHIGDSGILKVHCAAYTDYDKNNVLSGINCKDRTNVTVRRGSRYKSNSLPHSLMQNSVTISEYSTEIKMNKHKTNVSIVELGKDIKSENKLDCSIYNSEQEDKLAAISHPSFVENDTSFKEDHGQTAEEMKVLSSPGNECYLHQKESSVYNSDSHNQSLSVIGNSSEPSVDNINSTNSCQKIFGTTKCRGSASTEMKTSNVNDKLENVVVAIEEEKLTLSVENKCNEILKVIISNSEGAEVLWHVRSMSQFQWIFTFLNNTLRLYIHFDKSAEDGIIEDLDFISYLTGNADEDAKFVHFVLLKKFSKNNLKALCMDMKEVPELLEKISVDVWRMVAFLYEFQKVQLLYNMEIIGTSVSFNIRSYKLTIWFKINMDLSNWEQMLEDSITITQIFGHVNEIEIKNLAKGVKKDSHFLQNYFKAIQQYMKILERFGC